MATTDRIVASREALERKLFAVARMAYLLGFDYARAIAAGLAESEGGALDQRLLFEIGTKTWRRMEVWLMQSPQRLISPARVGEDDKRKVRI
ncbi:MAG: hypothetical protein GX442_23605 [Candidatus Riflebacteria bacterium]|nr:hypothetical protein [Candidatus Riflebacteria bacterium]